MDDQMHSMPSFGLTGPRKAITPEEKRRRLAEFINQSVAIALRDHDITQESRQATDRHQMAIDTLVSEVDLLKTQPKPERKAFHSLHYSDTMPEPTIANDPHQIILANTSEGWQWLIVEKQPIAESSYAFPTKDQALADAKEAAKQAKELPRMLIPKLSHATVLQTSEGKQVLIFGEGEAAIHEVIGEGYEVWETDS